ncbi:MAG: transcriptional repressor [Rhodospirillales bacterium]|nr:transcriptional repressor [Rhodospirillales bacterium]
MAKGAAHPLAEALKAANIRPSRQRLNLLGLIREQGKTHLTAEEAFNLAHADGLRLPLCSLYNNLNLFARSGLLRRITYGEKTWYCTNPLQHHHFLNVATGRYLDISGRQPDVDFIPQPPEGFVVEGVDIFVRLRPGNSPSKR